MMDLIFLRKWELHLSCLLYLDADLHVNLSNVRAPHHFTASCPLWGPCLQSPRVTDAMATLHFSSFQPRHLGDQQISDKDQENNEMGKVPQHSLYVYITSRILKVFIYKEWRWRTLISHVYKLWYLIGTLFIVISLFYFYPIISSLFPPCHLLLLVAYPVSCLTYPLTNCTILDGELISVRSAVRQQILQPGQLSLQHPVLLLEGHDRGHGSGCWEKKADIHND